MGASDYMVGNAPGGASYQMGNMAQQLFQMIGGLPQDYREGQKGAFEQGQRQRIEQMQKPIVGPDGQPTQDFSTILQELLKRGGGSTAQELLPTLQKRPFFDQLLKDGQGGDDGQPQGEPPQAPRGPITAPVAQTPKMLDQGGRGGQPALSATGTDSAGADTLNSIAAEHHVDLDAFLKTYPGAKGLLNRDLTPGQVKAVTQRMASFGGGSGAPIGSAEINQGNEQTPVGAAGGSPISPAPTAAAGGIAPATSGDDPAAGIVPPGFKGDSRAWRDILQRRVDAARKQGDLRGVVGIPSKSQEDKAAGYEKTISQINEAWNNAGKPTGEQRNARDPGVLAFENAKARGQVDAKTGGMSPVAFEKAKAWAKVEAQNGGLTVEQKNAMQSGMSPLEFENAKQQGHVTAQNQALTTEQKNVATGADQRAEQNKADVKYYDSLHRGLAGSGMIAAQQKQNVDMLRQVAAAPSFAPGAGTDLWLMYQRAAASFGINPTGAAPREVFNQVSARILADQFSGIKSMASETGEQGARIFKSMLDIEEKANITPQDSLEGIKAKLDLLDKTGDLMMKWADKADDYKLKHGKLDAGFDKELRADIAKARVENAVPKAASKGGPSVGHIEQGYRFKGGDPRDQKSWEPVAAEDRS